MTPYAIIETETGRVLRYYDGTPDEAVMQCGDGESAVANPELRRSATDYVSPDTGRWNARPQTPCTPSATNVPADGATTLTLSQMRDGTTLKIRGPVKSDLTSSGDNASYVLTFTTPGDYTITATAPFPARPKTIQITAT